MKTYKHIKSLEPASRILKHMREQREPVSGKEIADAVGLPYGTAMCYLATLESLNYVKIVGECFEIGMEMAMFWSRFKARKEMVRSEAERDLKALETGTTGDGGI